MDPQINSNYIVQHYSGGEESQKYGDSEMRISNNCISFSGDISSLVKLLPTKIINPNITTIDVSDISYLNEDVILRPKFVELMKNSQIRNLMMIYNQKIELINVFIDCLSYCSFEKVMLSSGNQLELLPLTEYILDQTKFVVSSIISFNAPFRASCLIKLFTKFPNVNVIGMVFVQDMNDLDSLMKFIDTKLVVREIPCKKSFYSQALEQLRLWHSKHKNSKVRYY